MGRLPPDQVAAIIARKVVDGRLPIGAPSAMLRGPGTGHLCPACEREIATSEIETECIFRDGRSIRVHMECFTEWERARTR